MTSSPDDPHFRNQDEGANKSPHQHAERENEFQAMIALYHPPVTLRSNHKNFLKTAWSIRQGYDGTKLRCVFCQKVGSLAELTLHHNDGDEEHNDPDNLSPACGPCHWKESWVVRRRKKAEASALERERVRVTRISTDQQTESITVYRHERERLGFNVWLYHPEKGIAKEGSRFSYRGIALQAVDIVGMGSSKTYQVYLDEDIAGGYWDKYRDPRTGVDMVERTKKLFPPERMGLPKTENST